MEKGFIQKCLILVILVVFCSGIIGCGESFSGAGKDVRRVGKGIKTIFVKDGQE